MYNYFESKVATLRHTAMFHEPNQTAADMFQEQLDHLGTRMCRPVCFSAPTEQSCINIAAMFLKCREPEHPLEEQVRGGHVVPTVY